MRGIWVYNPKPVKLTEYEKIEIIKKLNNLIGNSKRLGKIIKRILIKAGRIYLYYYYKVNKVEGVVYTLPFIDDKYFEYIFARITLFDKKLSNCRVSWQRHNNLWFELKDGNIEECLQFIDENEEYFYYEE